VTREAVVQEAEAETATTSGEAASTAEGVTAPEPAETAPTDEEHQP
jgi:hypothetical protein